MIVLSKEEKELIDRLDHPLYTVEFIKEWLDIENNDVMTNPIAALQCMSANGFYEAVKSMLKIQK